MAFMCFAKAGGDGGVPAGTLRRRDRGGGRDGVAKRYYIAMIERIQKPDAIVLRDGVETEVTMHPAPLDHKLNGRLGVDSAVLRKDAHRGASRREGDDFDLQQRLFGAARIWVHALLFRHERHVRPHGKARRFAPPGRVGQVCRRGRCGRAGVLPGAHVDGHAGVVQVDVRGRLCAVVPSAEHRVGDERLAQREEQRVRVERVIEEPAHRDRTP